MIVKFLISLKSLEFEQLIIKNLIRRDAWVAQSVEHLTLDFGSGHDLTVHGIQPHSGPHAGHGDCLGFSLSHLSAPSLLSLVRVCALSLPLSVSKNNKKTKQNLIRHFLCPF